MQRTSRSRKLTSQEESQQLYVSLQKIPWVHPLIMVILSLLDLALLFIYYRLQYLEGRTVLPQLLTVHAAIFAGVVILRRTSSPQTREISPLILLLLPGIGSLLFSTTYFALFFLGSRIKKDQFHHSFKDHDVEYQKSLKVDMSQVGRLMDLGGVFTFSDSINKKSVIVDLLSGDVSANARILKQGLGDPDPEVVHYTASTINYLEERYERAIQKARAKCVDELSKECLYHVAALYGNYMGSGLLEEDILPIYRASYIQVLELAEKEYGADAEVLRLLISAYLDNGVIEKAEEILQRALSLFPDDSGIRFAEMKYYFRSSHLHEVQRVAEIINKRYSDLSPDEKELIDFWLGKGEGKSYKDWTEEHLA